MAHSGDSKITALHWYDQLDVKPDDDVMVIVDVEQDQTQKLSLSQLRSILDEYDLELSEDKLQTLDHNRSSKAGISWIVNPSVYEAGYVPNTTIIPQNPLPSIDTNFEAPIKLKFKPHDCCGCAWPSLPHVVLRPKPGAPSTYYSLMTIELCHVILATVTFSREYLNDPFIFVDEHNTEIFKYDSNTGKRLRFKEGIISI
jgi:hypothetical protein